MTPLKDLSAEGIANDIFQVLTRNGVNLLNCVSQTYDGASVMSGKHRGVQKKIRDITGKALYVHCYAHRLNLVVVDTVKSLVSANDFFSLLQKLYILMSSAAVLPIFLEVQKRHYPKRSERTTLKRLSDTRWTCRIDSLRAIRKCFSAVIDALTSVAEHNDRERSIEAAGLLSRVQTLDFVSSLVIFENLLSITKGLSDQLQAQDLDLVGALDLLQVTVDQLVEARESGWQWMWQDILQLAQQNCVRVQIPGASSRGRVRKQMKLVILY